MTASRMSWSRGAALFGQVKIGDPRLPDTLVGPLIDEAALEAMTAVLGDGDRAGRGGRGGFYVRPAIVEAEAQEGTVLQETFAPILYVLALSRAGRGDRAQQRGRAGPVLVDLHQRFPRGGAVRVGRRLRLRDRQRQYRHVGRRNRRRVRRREGNRRWSRKRLGQVAGLHAAPDQHDQLREASYRSPRASASTSRHSARGSSASSRPARVGTRLPMPSASGSSGGEIR